MKRIIALMLVLSAFVCLFSCEKEETEIDYDVKEIDGYTVKMSEAPTDYVRIVMENGDAMLLELYPEIAPITVGNFKGLVSEKYYDGIIFHRVIEGFMIQGGDPDGDGYTNGDRPTIKGEFSLNGVKNDLSHERGVLSMARSSSPNSASTQFFIMHQTQPSLNGSYAAFGRLIAGYGTLDKIASTRVNSNDKPVNAQVMKEVRFVTIVNAPNGNN